MLLAYYLGGAFGPSLVGYVTQLAGDNLRVGMRIGCIFPVTLIIGLVLLRHVAHRDNKG